MTTADLHPTAEARPRHPARLERELADAESALRTLRATVNRLTHPESTLRRQLREVEVCFGKVARTLERARARTKAE